MKDFNDNQNCFVCGKKNQAGLQLEFRQNPENGETESGVVFPAWMQGWRNTVHGGLQATILDETMIKAAAATGIKCVTTEITVKYKKPALTGAAYLAAGKILEIRGRILTAVSRLEDDQGHIYAQASGKLFKI